MWRVITYVSVPKISNACMTDKKTSKQAQLCSFPAEDPCNTPPHRPHLWKIPEHCRPFIVIHQDHPPQVSKGGDHIEGDPIGAEWHAGDRLLLRHCQAPSFPLSPLLALHCVSVHPVQHPPQNQHVTQRAPWVGEVSLLHYHHGIRYVPVPEVHPHCRPHCRPATIPFNWAGHMSCLCEKC